MIMNILKCDVVIFCFSIRRNENFALLYVCLKALTFLIFYYFIIILFEKKFISRQCLNKHKKLYMYTF